MDFLITVFSFILLIFPLVVIHELGHFLAARLTGTRADVFAVGMGPRLFGWNKITGFTFGNLPETWDGGGHTDYRLCAFPVGGYVKIVGMIDESMDTAHVSGPAQPWEFRAKNAWQKAFMISAGVIMNVILALAIFIGLGVSGQEVIPAKEIAYIEDGSIAQLAGLKQGDIITKVNGIDVRNLADALNRIQFIDSFSDKTLTVDRHGDFKNINLDSYTISKSHIDGFGIYPIAKVLFNSVLTLEPAGKAGIAVGDTVVSIDSIPMYSVIQFQKYVKANSTKELHIRIRRASGEKDFSIVPNSSGKIGVGLDQAFGGEKTTIQYGLMDGISMGFTKIRVMGNGFIHWFQQLFSGGVSVKESTGGVITIAQTAKSGLMAGAYSFFSLMALLSLNLAVLNILPIPVLDGGHLVIIIVEGILRREISVKFKMAIQYAGLALVGSFMLYVTFNEISRIFFR